MKSSAVSRNHLPWRGGGAGRSGAGRRSGGGRSSSRQQDALLRPFLDQQGGGSRSMATARRERVVNRGDQSPSFRFREQPPM
jgi:hypothetical protein